MSALDEGKVLEREMRSAKLRHKYGGIVEDEKAIEWADRLSAIITKIEAQGEDEDIELHVPARIVTVVGNLGKPRPGEPPSFDDGAQGAGQEPVAQVWNKGVPPHPYKDEWFIARTTYGDKVVLRALPEEYSYDFKTADETYIKADKIVAWMQFPDSEFKSYASPISPAAIRNAALEEAAKHCENAWAHADLRTRFDISESIRALQSTPHQEDKG